MNKFCLTIITGIFLVGCGASSSSKINNDPDALPNGIMQVVEGESTGNRDFMPDIKQNTMPSNSK